MPDLEFTVTNQQVCQLIFFSISFEEKKARVVRLLRGKKLSFGMHTQFKDR